MVTTKSPAKKAPAKKATTVKPKTTTQPAKKSTDNTSTSTTCIVDNGGWQIKYGLLTTSKPSTMPNCTARPPHQLTVLAGDEILRMKNLSQLVYNHPLERGMIVDGSTQCAVWSRLLNVCGVNILPSPLASNKAGGSKKMLATNVNSNNVQVVLLKPPFVPSVISEGVDKILFRELGVGRVVKVLGGCMAAVKYLQEGCGPNRLFDDKTQVDDVNSNETNWINDNTKCCCVVDSGHSFTHVIPTQSEAAVKHAIRRLDLGGKVLTNLLKEAVTYRQWNMMDEYHVVNDAKEQLCYISQQFNEDMKHARQTRRGLRRFDREFLLPDFVNTFQGTVQLPMPLQMMRELEEDKRQQLKKDKETAKKRDNKAAASNKNSTDVVGSDNITVQPKQKKKRKPSEVADEKVNDEPEENDASDLESDEETEQQRLQRVKRMREQEQKRREAEAKDRQALALSVERFAVPEVLFTPSDLGLDFGGIADAIVESINACDATLRAAMYHNVLLVGGNAKMPGFKNRLETELRKLAPTQYVVRVFLPEDPLCYAWEGAKIFSQRPDFQEKFSIDRISWEAMKKKGADQQSIWGDRIYNKQQ